MPSICKSDAWILGFTSNVFTSYRFRVKPIRFGLFMLLLGPIFFYYSFSINRPRMFTGTLLRCLYRKDINDLNDVRNRNVCSAKKYFDVFKFNTKCITNFLPPCVFVRRKLLFCWSLWPSIVYDREKRKSHFTKIIEIIRFESRRRTLDDARVLGTAKKTKLHAWHTISRKTKQIILRAVTKTRTRRVTP